VASISYILFYYYQSVAQPSERGAGRTVGEWYIHSQEEISGLKFLRSILDALQDTSKVQFQGEGQTKRDQLVTDSRQTLGPRK
jgi:hypothetical protein